jgi:amino acid adenylation domain-containing protein
MERAAEMYGDMAAVVGEDGRLTYGELNACANQLAHLLQKRGVGRGSVVGICMERSAAMITGMVAVLKAGAAYLPMDAGYPVERILYSLQESKTAILLTHTQLQARFSECGVKVLCVDQPGLLAGMPCSNPERKPEHNDCAYVIYTSGSTGRPKGVMISHRSLLNLALWHQHSYQVKAGDRASQIASPGFDACVWELWPYLISGATILVVDEETKLSPAKLQKWIVENDINLAFLATPLAEAVLREFWPVPTRLRALLVGGDRLTQRPGESLAFRVINHYGPTEATVVTTAGEVAAMDKDGRLPDIGRPIANYKVYILDQDLQPVPIGVVGELYIGGEGVALGYVRDPDPGAPRFVDNPFGPGRLYRSGDLASFLKNGRIHFVGRMDEQVKIRGYRIELDEIKVVLDKHPMVAQSAVALESTPNGQSIVAYIVLREDSNKGIEQLRAGLAGQLPHYMIPSKFVLLASLPLTPNGKVDRNKLDKLQPVALTNNHVQPQTELQKRVERIWNEVLHVEDIGIHDNFFQLGGHSLLAAQVMTRINNVFRLELPLTTLFDVPTIAGLAGYVEQVLGDDTELEALMELLQDQLRSTPSPLI